MAYTEKAVLNEEETEAVNGGLSTPNLTVNLDDPDIAFNLEDSNFRINLDETDLAAELNVVREASSVNELGILSPASGSKKGFFSWFKNLFNNF